MPYIPEDNIISEEVSPDGETSETQEKSVLRLWFENMEPEKRKALEDRMRKEERRKLIKRIMLFVSLIVLAAMIKIIADQII